MSSNPYMPVMATLEGVVAETPNIKTFSLRPETPLAFAAGQFVELTVPGLGEAPFTPSSAPGPGERMDITIMRAGRVTEKLHALDPGVELGLRGPLGQPYPLDKFRGKEVLVVGGGVGLAPLRALLFALFAEMDRYEKIIVRYGARSPADIVYRDKVAEGWGKDLDLMLTVDEADEGWTGNVGVVTTIMEPDKLAINPQNGVAVVCGPPIMMKFATFKLVELGYRPGDIYLSMEKNMSCGVGKCGHCRIGNYYACKDGPVFTYGQVEGEDRIWD